jgi:hypothetical protein
MPGHQMTLNGQKYINMIIIQQLLSFEDLKKHNFSSLGFFQSTSYQEIFISHFSKIDNIIILGFLDEEQIIGYGIFEKINDLILFSGMKKVLEEQEVTDYGDITIDDRYQNQVRDIWTAILQWFKNQNITKLQLDYVREDSKTYEIFKDQAIEKEIAPRIILPESWERYLENLERKDRQELKRKLRRLDTVQHEYKVINPIDSDSFNDYIRLHRLSNSQKEQFMTEGMESFFKDLSTAEEANWQICLNLLLIEGKNAASIFTFESKDCIYGYNSGFDPQYNYYSAGLLVHALAIQRAINQKKKIYDFLRGRERYKFDLGGKPVKLFQVNISL